MSKKDLNEIAKIEKAIKDKYGQAAIENPKKSWDQEKEKKYLEDLKKFYNKKTERKNTEQADGFIIKESKKRKKSASRTCPVCGSYSFSARDDLYMLKFECCFECYIQYVEAREDRWKTGWRPNN